MKRRQLWVAWKCVEWSSSGLQNCLKREQVIVCSVVLLETLILRIDRKHGRSFSNHWSHQSMATKFCFKSILLCCNGILIFRTAPKRNERPSPMWSNLTAGAEEFCLSNKTPVFIWSEMFIQNLIAKNVRAWLNIILDLVCYVRFGALLERLLNLRPTSVSSFNKARNYVWGLFILDAF